MRDSESVCIAVVIVSWVWYRDRVTRLSGGYRRGGCRIGMAGRCDDYLVDGIPIIRIGAGHRRCFCSGARAFVAACCRRGFDVPVVAGSGKEVAVAVLAGMIVVASGTVF